MNETHNPDLRCWVTSANEPGSDFPIQNLPFGVFRRKGAEEEARVGVAIGDRVLDIPRCLNAGLLDGTAAEAASFCNTPSLNALMALAPEYGSALRLCLSRLLSLDNPALRDHQRREEMLPAMIEIDLLLPCVVGDYTDFYASIHHARNVGSIFRPDSPLLPNYKYVPIAYHGRASSIVPSGAAIRRPFGQFQDDAGVHFVPTRQLDYELEAGFFIGSGNPLSHPIPVDEAESHLFGMCLVNDWSARDVQKWEYQPLGPFLGKSFATTVSPWVVTMEALEPYRVPAYRRPPGDPAPLPHLASNVNQQRGGIDITLEVFLRSSLMIARGIDPFRLGRSRLRDLYWTPAQLVAHHTSNGCNLRPGDLLASGTLSGEDEDARGSMLELTSRARGPILLPDGEERKFLQDGDEVIMRGYSEHEGFVRIGFGECRGRILPAAETQ